MPASQNKVYIQARLHLPATEFIWYCFYFKLSGEYVELGSASFLSSILVLSLISLALSASLADFELSVSVVGVAVLLPSLHAVIHAMVIKAAVNNFFIV